MSNFFLNPLSLLNIVSGHLHRGNILGAVEVLKDLPWKDGSKTNEVSRYAIPEVHGKRVISPKNGETLSVTLQNYTFSVSETGEGKQLKVTSPTGYSFKHNYE